MSITLGSKEFFKNISQIKFEGRDTDNPLAFRWYDENKVDGDRLWIVLVSQSGEFTGNQYRGSAVPEHESF